MDMARVVAAKGGMGLMLRAGVLVNGLHVGRHRSTRRGAGTDFHDFRPYSPGDAVGNVDWKVYGRTDRHYVRRYQRRSELRVHLVVDASASMGFADHATVSTLPTKLAYAARLAAAAGMLAVRQADRVALSLVDRQVRAHLPMGGTWSHLQRVVATLEQAAPGEGVGDLAASLREAHRLSPRRGLVVVLSDLLDELARLRHARSGVVLWQVLSPSELELRPAEPRVELVDPETGERVPTDAALIRARYLDLLQAHIARVRRAAGSRGVRHTLLRTDEPELTALRRVLAAA